MSSALSALQTNSTALRVVSDNVSNLNTPGYTRQVVQEAPTVTAGQVSGVEVADIQRVVDQFLTQESLAAGGQSASYDTQSNILDQLNGLLGKPGDGTALTTQLGNVFGALGQATLSPTSGASQSATLNAMKSFASSVSTLSQTITNLQGQVDQQVSASVTSANDLIKQIFDLNQQIHANAASGSDQAGLEDQRDQAVQSLSQLIGVRTIQQPNGNLTVMTADGTSLVGDSYAQLSYAGGSQNGTFGPIMIQGLSGSTGLPVGPAQPLDAHLGSGKIEGLISVRDGALGDLQQELGSFARTTALAFNAQHNANAAFPPPSTLSGRDSGLLATDNLNFTGKTAIAVADQSGKLVGSVAIDFGAGTLSVNGGPATGIGTTAGSFVSALNTALGSVGGSASLTDGVLSIAASGTNGVVVQDDATTPADRGGAGFSQFFGLNDLFEAAAPSILATGLSASDASGLAAGGQIDLSLKGPNGDIAKQASVTITAGMSIGNVISALNTAMGGAANFTLNSDGSMSVAPSSNFAGYQLQVSGDSTARGTTGMSFTQLFGIGGQQLAAQAQGFSVNAAIAASPSLLAMGQPADIATAVIGDQIVSHGDSSGVLALQALQTQQQSFARVGQLAQQNVTLGNYAGALYQDVATRTQSVKSSQTTQDDRLQEAQARINAKSGVNLDEELSKMMTYQQAYSAGARLLTVVDQLYNTLMQVQ